MSIEAAKQLIKDQIINND